MSFNNFNQQLQEDVCHIQIAAAQSGDANAQVGRVQSITYASMICLQRIMGPAAAAHWLHEIADRFAAEASGHVQ